MSKEIDIVISRKKRGSADGKPKRGVIDPRRKKDLGRRRLLQEGYLNVWDLGQITDGSGGWTTPDIRIDPYTLGDESSLLSLLNEPLIHAFSAWKTRYRKIAHGASADLMRLGADIFAGGGGHQPFLLYNEAGTSMDDNWSDSGLRLPGSGIFSDPYEFIRVGAGNTTPPTVPQYWWQRKEWFEFSFGGSATHPDDQKITALPSYSAPDVGYSGLSASKPIDLYVVPKLMIATDYSRDVMGIVERDFSDTADYSAASDSTVANLCARKVVRDNTLVGWNIVQNYPKGIVAGQLVAVVVSGGAVRYIWYKGY